MGMSLSEGGHLTHGMASILRQVVLNVVANHAKEAIHYADPTWRGTQPKIIIAGASAYSLRINFSAFAKAVGAIMWVDMALCWTDRRRLLSEPMRHADVVTSTTHKTMRGPRAVHLDEAEHEKAINSATSGVHRAAR